MPDGFVNWTALCPITIDSQSDSFMILGWCFAGTAGLGYDTHPKDKNGKALISASGWAEKSKRDMNCFSGSMSQVLMEVSANRQTITTEDLTQRTNDLLSRHLFNTKRLDHQHPP
jgi:hypothetical protein